MKQRDRDILISQLFAARQQIDATLVVLGVTVEDGDAKCEHPKDKRVDHSVMGKPEQWECTVCGFHYDASKES